MTDGWVDCPSLGPGWKRREVLRKSGTRSGHSDTYYISPRGEKIRSRVELLRLLGCSRDLTDFDYRRGIFVEPNTEPLPSALLSPTEGSPQRVKKSSKKHLLHLTETTLPSKKPPYLQVFLEPQPSPGQGLLDQKRSEPELGFLGENQANMQSQQSELPVTLDQQAPKPRKRYQQPLPAISSPGKIEDVTLQESNPKEAMACCASCRGEFPEVMLPSQRRCRWLCPDCRAQRRAFNREQRYFKQIGCGVCQACQMSQDCGICSVCVLRAQNPKFHIDIKCLLRRCLKIVKKGLDCGICQACKITEDCGTCAICLRRQRPGMKRQWKCLKRRCLKRKKKVAPKKDSCSSKKVIAESSAKNVFTPKQCGQKKPTLTTGGQFPKAQLAPDHPHRRQSATPKWKSTIQRDPGDNSLVRHRHSSKNQQNQKCGECEACLLKTDCGRCDFCCDKPKFGGQNLKQQKCRWRRCLQFAMESSLTSEWTEVPKSLGLEMPKQEKLHLQPQPQLPPPVKLKKEIISSASHQPTKEYSVVPAYIQQEQGIPHHPILTTSVIGKDPDTKLPVVNLLIATSPKNKQDYAEPGGNCQASSDSLVSAGFPQFKKLSRTPSTEVVILDDSEDNEMGLLQQIQPPVIMEVYSLGGVQPLSQLDSVLREFLAELNEIPLPAHWEVLPPLGSPDLRLIQRSKHSTMSAAVIHIRPGLFFHVVMQDLLVPQEHELYASHPARLTTVDEVVELICDLEAYRLCLGWPAGWHARERSETCDILVHSGCCPHCRLNPWPSGSGTH
ncbi:methyl-CpG-binding domain protein 1 isoform X3 [Pantherophis guttatus]|uniref:Methyl-CpG-binding domain protein 1 isoform X3 n=1 Tax=Pantherophis guttatus TaxID=94885 RepID=A0A6P9D2J0_PANGU|nr:methyl-CpG-binding domain protein 1 isoform X3 [Pantherophis guttatus]